MPSHAAPRRRGRAPAWVVALAGVVVVVGGAQGTYAYWSDQATVSGSTLTAGTIDLDVNGSESVTTHTDLTMPAMVPGTSVATVLTVANGGTAPIRWTAVTTASDVPTAALPASAATLASAVVVKVTSDSAITTTTAGGTCAGTALAGSGTTLGANLVATPRELAAGASEKVCVQLSMAPDAPSSVQGSSAAIGIALTGSQVIS